MKNPKSILPWKGTCFDDFQSDKKDIINAGYTNICGEIEDFDYILQACNNFPRAIELLKNAADWDLIGSEIGIEINEFLNSLEQ